MAVIRTKNYVPDVYIDESRDFQLFLKILDAVENSVKFDIDEILCVNSTADIPSIYIERLKSKLGFYTNKIYPDDDIRFALEAFPRIIRYKGSASGIYKCVNTFLKLSGIKSAYKIDIYNNSDEYPYTVRIGVESPIEDTSLLEEMLYYILPTGYFVEIYFYANLPERTSEYTFRDAYTVIQPENDDNSSVIDTSNEPSEGTDLAVDKNSPVLGTVQLGTVFLEETTSNDNQGDS